MRKLMFLALVLIGFVSCKSPNQEKVARTEISLDSISIIPNWNDSQIINLELIKTKTVTRNGATQSGSSTSNIELVLTKNENNTWTGSWRIKDVQLPSVNNPLEKKLENLVTGFVYNFTLDSTGTITGLVNWEEIQTKGFEALNMIINEFKNVPTMSPQIIEQIKMNVGEMFNTKEKIETYLMQEVQLYFALGGIEMTKSDTIEGSAYITHPLTGDLIAQNIKSIYQKAYSDSTCDIQISQTIDESDLYDAVKNTVNKYAGEDKTNEFQNEMQNAKFDVKVTSNYNISLITGLVEKVTALKEITVGGDTRIDKTEIIRK